MGKYGIGASPAAKTHAATGNAPPVYPGNGAGGPGILGRATLTPATGELSDLTTGRITLAIVDLAFIGLIAFYIWTRSSQGGG